MEIKRILYSFLGTKLLIAQKKNNTKESDQSKMIALLIEISIHRYGTSSASMPIALDEANREGLLSKGDYVLLVSFGAGLTWGALIVRWSI